MKSLAAVLPTGRNHWLLSLGTLVDSFGFGLYVTAGAVYFTRWAGLSAQQVGFGLSVAGIVGFAGALSSGHLADRFGPRRVSVSLCLAQAFAMAAFALVRSFSVFLLVTALFAFVEHGGATVREALVGRLFPGGTRVSVQAYLRSVLNVGISAGTVTAGVVLQVDVKSLYIGLILINAMSFLALAGLTAMLPAEATAAKAEPSGAARRTALGDWPYLSVALLNGLLALHSSVLMIGLPLWITLHTHAPRATVAALFLCNTALAVLLQIRASRGSESLPGAARAVAASSVVNAVACLLFSTTSATAQLWAIPALVLATVCLTAGELLQSAGGWGLSFGLAPEDRQGAYLGVFSLGYALRDWLGPMIVTSVVISHGVLGWAVLSAVFLVSGFSVLPAARWAIKTRPVPGTTPDNTHISVRSSL